MRLARLDEAAAVVADAVEPAGGIALGLGKPQNGSRDVFDSFFENKDLDPVTGGLLGRYVAEERDSGRKFAECYGLLCAEADKAAAKSNGAKGKGGGKAKGKKK